MVPMTRGPEFFHVFVCGGPGPNSLFTGQHRGEVPIKKILLGQPPEKAANRDAMGNPGALDWFIGFARGRAAG